MFIAKAEKVKINIIIKQHDHVATKSISYILGRTGTMICVWLVEAGVFSSATESLDYFGNRRTDTNVSKKFQGVSHNSNTCTSYNLFNPSFLSNIDVQFR